MVKVGEQEVLLVNHENTIYALNPKCPHLGLSLKSGKITDDGQGPVITCKFHQRCWPKKQNYDDVEEMVSNCVCSKFNLKTGECAAWSQSFLGIPGTGIIGGVVGNVSVDGFITTP
uniref:Rieske domain-containing protein n=1 Tax=Guillardia theta TaxID=55529 RepID=A0A7S4PBZ6_GUITH|mmetsp:Transcript_4740/g.17221  ORF Transcript_4740/g.17221 Transcript_4740/m.17221 type:complete len:116 (+) Transcript_4740:273-620(+)